MKLLDYLSGKLRPEEEVISPGRMAFIQRTWKRRTADIVWDAFQRAIDSKSVEDATDLLDLLHNWYERRPAKLGWTPRQADIDALTRGHQELELLKAALEAGAGQEAETAQKASAA